MIVSKVQFDDKTSISWTLFIVSVKQFSFPCTKLCVAADYSAVLIQISMASQ